MLWWLETESNRRHEDFQSSALPTELSSQKFLKPNFWFYSITVSLPLHDILYVYPSRQLAAISCSNARSYRAKPQKNMEEVEGFEPPRAFTPLSVFKTDPFSRTWVYLLDLVDPVGLEPTTNRL
jgi:hypothetical protein